MRAGQTGRRLSWACTTLVIAASYAGLDEWHQSFVPSREARVREVAIHALGMAFGSDSRLAVCETQIELCRTVRILGGR